MCLPDTHLYPNPLYFFCFLAMTRCSSYLLLAMRQLIVSNWRLACNINISLGGCPVELAQGPSRVALVKGFVFLEKPNKQTNQKGQGKHYQTPSRKPAHTQTNKYFQTYVAQTGHRSESCVCRVAVWYYRCVLQVFPLTSLVILFVWLSRLSLMCSSFCVVCLSVCLETVK